MKKFFLLFVFVLFSQCVFAENVLESISFKVTNLTNGGKVAGDATEYLYDEVDNGLILSWQVQNITDVTVNYYVTIKKISLASSHQLKNCIGGVCIYQPGAYFPDLWRSPETVQLSLKPGEKTNPISTTHIEIFAGNNLDDMEESIDSLEVSFISDDMFISDTVRFLCIWDFENTSVQVIEDVSNKIFPNPTSDYLHLDIANIFSSIEIYDVNGERVIKQNIAGMSQVKIALTTLNSGSYYGYLVDKNGNKKSFRFVKQ